MNKDTIYQFFEYIRKLEQHHFISTKNEFYQVALGEDGPPEKESIRFKTNYSFSFPDNSGFKLINKKGKKNRYHDIVTNIMGIAGISGVLPQHYTRLILSRIKHNDDALAEFLDLFNHRLISLYYCSWTKFRPDLQHERSIFLNRQDPFSNVIRSFSGHYGIENDNVPLYFSGAFSKKIRNVATLENILFEILNLPIDIKSFVGTWINLKNENKLYIDGRGNGRNNKLGEGVLLGKRYWDVQSMIEISIFNISISEQNEFRKGSKKFNFISELIQSYVPDPITVNLKLHIEDDLSNFPALGKGMCLSNNAWLKSDKNKSSYIRNVFLNKY